MINWMNLIDLKFGNVFELRSVELNWNLVEATFKKHHNLEFRIDSRHHFHWNKLLIMRFL